jgi:hypothetical protein
MSRDRTVLFRQLASRAQQLLPSTSSTPSTSTVSHSRVVSEAGRVSRELAHTTALLEELSSLARDTSKFADCSYRVEELTAEVKAGIQRAAREMEALQAIAAQHRTGNNQLDAHAQHVVNTLKNQVANTTKNFSTVLQTRSNSLKMQTERRKQFSSGKSIATMHRQRPSKITIVEYADLIFI